MSKEKILTVGQVRVKGGKYYTVINSCINGKRKAKWEKTVLSSGCGNKKKAYTILRNRMQNFVVQGSDDKLVSTSGF